MQTDGEGSREIKVKRKRREVQRVKNVIYKIYERNYINNMQSREYIILLSIIILFNAIQCTLCVLRVSSCWPFLSAVYHKLKTCSQTLYETCSASWTGHHCMYSYLTRACIYCTYFWVHVQVHEYTWYIILYIYIYICIYTHIMT